VAIIGLDAFGLNAFRSYSPPVRNIKYLEMKNAIYDEIHIREKTDGVTTENVKEDWQMDTILLAKFLGDLEAGNINNAGVKIEKFAIKRRKLNELKSITLAYKDFVNNNQFVYTDYTQPNDEFIYSIVPVGENGLEEQENSIIIKSDFTGWFLVDKDTNEVLAFDKFIGNEGTFDTTLNQGRVQIDTLTRFPSVFYTDQEYHEFQLKTVIIPEDWQRSGKKYEQILNQFVRSHKPFLAKGGSGEIYVVDVHSPSKSAPQNVWTGRDYFELTLTCTEIMTYEEYMQLSE
jgi:hypothetical protein